jgi:hypothetical protein
MSPEDVAQLQAYHQEAFTDYLVAERTLQIALHLDEDVAPVREKRDDLRHSGSTRLRALM